MGSVGLPPTTWAMREHAPITGEATTAPDIVVIIRTNALRSILVSPLNLLKFWDVSASHRVLSSPPSITILIRPL